MAIQLIPYFKAFHIIGFVSWFAGLFYLVRLFVYHAEAGKLPQQQREVLLPQYELMQARLYNIITTPAMVITLLFGCAMLFANPIYLQLPWMHIKLTLLCLLLAYHFYCGATIKRLKEGRNTLTSYHFRLLNELPTLFLVSIVLVAVLKSALNFLYAFFGVLAFGILLFVGVRFYKKIRESK